MSDLPTRARQHPWPNEGLSPARTTMLDPAPSHMNVGKTVIYRGGKESASQMPGIILGQRGEIADVVVFTYHGPVVQEGCRFMAERAHYDAGDNVCWLLP